MFNFSHPYGNAIVKSHGSGFIVREDGLILTNAHVVSRQSTVNVKLQDGRVVKGEVQAVDTVTDLATIKVNEVSTFIFLLCFKQSGELQ